MSALSTVFAERLPLHPWASNNIHYGQRPYPRDIAVGFNLIQYNAPRSIGWLGFDIDRPSAAFDWDDMRAPGPNMVMVNCSNGHAHLLYGLDRPVHDYAEARSDPLRYLAAVDCGLSSKLKADPAYNQRLVKNPLVATWLVIEPRAQLYDLAELADYVDLRPCRELPDIGFGRNYNLFEELRRWAYAARREAWFSADAFSHDVLIQAQRINSGFPIPLPASEVRATSRSVSRWTWERMSSRSFQAIQVARGRRSGEVRRGKVAERNNLILVTIEKKPELTHTEIADLFGVSRSTIVRVVKNVSRTISDNKGICDELCPLQQSCKLHIEKIGMKVKNAEQIEASA